VRRPYLPDIEGIGINVLESVWLLIPDYLLEGTDVGVLCDLDREHALPAIVIHPAVELEIGIWKMVSAHCQRPAMLTHQRR
jgi:hypothetical protein